MFVWTVISLSVLREAQLDVTACARQRHNVAVEVPAEGDPIIAGKEARAKYSHTDLVLTAAFPSKYPSLAILV
eukprot:4333056-Amphidinium_carterae.1